MNEVSNDLDLSKLTINDGVKAELFDLVVNNMFAISSYFLYCSYVEQPNSLFLFGCGLLIILSNLGNSFFKLFVNCFFPKNITKFDLGSLLVSIGFLPIYVYYCFQASEKLLNKEMMMELLYFLSCLAFLSGSLFSKRINNVSEFRHQKIFNRTYLIVPKKNYWILFGIYYAASLLLFFLTFTILYDYF